MLLSIEHFKLYHYVQTRINLPTSVALSRKLNFPSVLCHQNFKLSPSEPRHKLVGVTGVTFAIVHVTCTYK